MPFDSADSGGRYMALPVVLNTRVVRMYGLVCGVRVALL